MWKSLVRGKSPSTTIVQGSALNFHSTFLLFVLQNYYKYKTERKSLDSKKKYKKTGSSLNLPFKSLIFI